MTRRAGLLARRRFAGGFIAAALLLVISGTCATRATCGDVAAIGANPTGGTGRGVAAGPLFFAFGWPSSASGADISWSSDADLHKVLIAPVRRYERTLTVSGRNCDDGVALRFAQSAPWTPGSSPTRADIERATTTDIHIAGTDPGTADDYLWRTSTGGYFVFLEPGRWLIEVREDRDIVGSFVVAAKSSP
jgi:hypothetical protein